VKWFLLLMCPMLAHAQQIVPMEDLYCGASAGQKLLSVRVSLLEGKEVRKYDDFDLTQFKLGPNTATFTKTAAVLTTINGMRLACEFQRPGWVDDMTPAQRWGVSRVYKLPVGSVPTVVMELVPNPAGGGWIVIRGKGAL
jgi:hypothetical protein